ncbi:MAG: hydrogen gas-evolving membrane-bound hydrogenase subunit E [Aristaeellaceae bacterium]
MARIRNDYENSWFPRLQRWLKGGSTRLDEQLQKELVDQTRGYTREHIEALVQEQENRTQQRLQQQLEHEQSMYEHVRQWSQTKGAKLVTWSYRILAVLICVSIIWVLLTTASYLPPFGHPDNPVNNEVSQRYIEQGMQETGAVNIVAGMILDYRAFDTLGESNVLFVAACSVIILLRISGSRDGKPTREQLESEADDRMYEPKNDMILQHAASFLVPVILLFGIYVILNGHISPGGGFSGGAVMGAGLILYLNAFGFKKTERFFTFKTFRTVSLCALSFYALSKAYSFFTGANHLHSIITPGTPGKLFSAGLIPYLNIAVGLVVCCTMYAFYTLFRKGDM